MTVRKALNVLLAVAMACLLMSVVLSAIALTKALNVSETAESKIAATQTETRVIRTESRVAKQLAIDEHASRVAAAKLSCDESNEHHAHAIKGLEKLAAENPPPTPLSPAQKLQQHKIIVGLASSFAPHYNCAVRVRILTSH